MKKTSDSQIVRAARVYTTNTLACRAMGISLTTFRRRCDELEVETPNERTKKRK